MDKIKYKSMKRQLKKLQHQNRRLRREEKKRQFLIRLAKFEKRKNDKMKRLKWISDNMKVIKLNRNLKRYAKVNRKCR